MNRIKFKSVFFSNFIGFFLLMSLILISVTVYMYNVVISSMRAQIDTINNTTNRNYQAMCEKAFRESEYTMSKLIVNNDTRNFVFGEESLDLFYNLQDNLCAEIQKYKGINTYVNSIYIYSEVNDAICDGYNITETGHFEDSAWLETIQEVSDDNLITLYRKMNNVYPNVISFVKIIKGYQRKGAVVVNIDVDKFAQSFYIDDDNLMKYIVSKDEVILCANDTTLIFDELSEHENVLAPNKNDVYSEIESQYYDWKYVCVTKSDEYRKEIRTAVFRVLLTGLLLLFFAVIFGFVYAKKTTKPIKTIADVLDDVDDSDVDIIHDYEVERIVSNIMKLINKNKNLEIELEKGLEKLNKIHFAALQLQINPHFLYNTLNSIGIKVRKENPQSRIPKMINNLASLMRISLDNKNELITVECECEYTRIYIDLLRQRYGDIIDVNIDYGDTGTYRIIKLILQPIIENAVYHGILKSGRHGLISIMFKKENNNLKITVSDNGVGMTEEEYSRLNESINKSYVLEDKEHLGLKNVNERIKILFGNEYGIEITGAENCGTTVSAIMPVIK